MLYNSKTGRKRPLAALKSGLVRREKREGKKDRHAGGSGGPLCYFYLREHYSAEEREKKERTTPLRN